jgi:hypothetical protein
MNRETRKQPRDTDPDANPASRRDTSLIESGRVTHDERGNAIWEWAGSNGEAAESSTQRIKKLDNPSLSLADEPAKSLGGGYSPYDSGGLDKGVLEKKEPPRKKDLRRLGEWMKLKRNAEKAKSGAE